jgi:membrane protease subunit HflK
MAWQTGGQGRGELPPVEGVIWQKLRGWGQSLRRWGLGKSIGTGIGIVVVIWLLTGIYMVNPGEVAVVRQFGKEVDQTGPGLNYHLPAPIQSKATVDMAQIRRAEIGFRTVKVPGGKTAHEPVLAEALMLTGDENIADIQVLVQYRVKDASNFLFKVKNPEQALGTAAEVALRGVIGSTTIDDAMTVGRPRVEADTREFLQRLLDDYQAGLQIVELKLQVVDAPDKVKDAFHEVVRALEDKDRLMRQAEGYAADLVPKSRGNAEIEIKAAEAYKEARVRQSQGDATKFLEVLEEYQKAKDVTRERLYLETIERVLAETEIFIIDPQSAGGNLLPLLPLKEMVELEKSGSVR